MSFSSIVKSLLGSSATANSGTFATCKARLLTTLQSASLSTIRLFVAKANGLGHQATTVNIIWRLTALGFNQNVQIIFEGANVVTDETYKKLVILIPGLAACAGPLPSDNTLTINGVTLTFICLTDFTARYSGSGQKIAFGITGGYDTQATDMGVLINTTYFLKLQPYCWLQPNILYTRAGTASASTTVNLSTLAVLGKLAFTRQNYIQAIQALDATGLNQITPAEKKATYSSILAACNPSSPQWANMLPVYGIEPDAVSGEVKTLPGVKPEDILFNLIAAIAYAQDNSMVANLKKGVIIPIIATIPDTNYTALKDAVWSTSDYTNINTYAQANNFVTRVIIVSYDNLNLPGYLTEIQTNAKMILLIKMNGLPVQAFNNMYVKSTLPGMFEGKGTASYMLNSSLPFFNLTPLAAQRYIYIRHCRLRECQAPCQSPAHELHLILTPILPLQTAQLARLQALPFTPYSVFCKIFITRPPTQIISRKYKPIFMTNKTISF